MVAEGEDMVQLAMSFLKRNYNYIWLKSMLEKGKRVPDHRYATLITGSSHALNGIEEKTWECALNCSMHSQDLYYDFMCAREVVQGAARFKRCFILFGYYIAYQDLSLSKGMRDYIVSPVYYPIFRDAHNWKTPVASDMWKDFPEAPMERRDECERLAMQWIYKEATYYSKLKRRKPFYDFAGRSWPELSQNEKDEFAQMRAEGHNSVLKYAGSFPENQEILNDYVHFLHLNGISPIVVIPPFSAAYVRCVETELKNAVIEMVNRIEEDLSFIDLNESNLFDDTDFIDTDHLNEAGARKLSEILVKEFGR